MLTLETTPGCGQTPRILNLLEELGEPYEVVLHPDSHFFQTMGRPGPILHDGALEIRNGLTAFRHILRTRGARLSCDEPGPLARIEEWIDLAWGPLGLGIVMLLDAMRASRGTETARAPIHAVLGEIERALAQHRFVAGEEFSAADCALSGLTRIGGLIDLSPYPNVSRYAAEMAARPAYARAARSMSGVATASQVLSFWFGEPITDDAMLRAAIRRWFVAGRDLDAEIKQRFAPTVEAALAGKLADWAETPRGRLALVLVIDQFARHVFRDDPRAFSGDAVATATVLVAIERGDLEALNDTVERSFLLMPLLHSEDLSHHVRHTETIERVAALSTPVFAPMIEGGREQSEKYRTIIERFGRFPHRNAVLGRASTEAEQAFLRDFSAKAPPKIAREMLIPRSGEAGTT